MTGTLDLLDVGPCTWSLTEVGHRFVLDVRPIERQDLVARRTYVDPRDFPAEMEAARLYLHANL